MNNLTEIIVYFPLKEQSRCNCNGYSIDESGLAFLIEVRELEILVKSKFLNKKILKNFDISNKIFPLKGVLLLNPTSSNKFIEKDVEKKDELIKKSSLNEKISNTSKSEKVFSSDYLESLNEPSLKKILKKQNISYLEDDSKVILIEKYFLKFTE